MASSSSTPPPPASVPPAAPPAAPPSDHERVHAVIRGQVQGVYYRSSASEQARVLGVSGWVRNLRGGEVELVAEGPRPVLEKLLEWCRLGPPAAQVEAVDATWSAATGEWPDFKISRG